MDEKGQKRKDKKTEYKGSAGRREMRRDQQRRGKSKRKTKRIE